MNKCINKVFLSKAPNIIVEKCRMTSLDFTDFGRLLQTSDSKPRKNYHSALVHHCYIILLFKLIHLFITKHGDCSSIFDGSKLKKNFHNLMFRLLANNLKS